MTATVDRSTPDEATADGQGFNAAGGLLSRMRGSSRAAAQHVGPWQYGSLLGTKAFLSLIVAGVLAGPAALAWTITALGWWPTLLGGGLGPGGSLAAFVCLAVFGLVLPFTVGPRILVGLGRTTGQVASQLVVAPFMGAYTSVTACEFNGLPTPTVVVV